MMPNRILHGVVASVTVILVVAAMLCLFDDDHDARPDLCNLLLLPLAGLVVGAPSLRGARLVSVPIQIEPAAPPEPPSPPPRS